MSSILDLTTSIEETTRTNFYKEFYIKNQSTAEWCFQGDFFDRIEEGYKIRKSLGDPRVEPYELEDLMLDLAYFFASRRGEKTPQLSDSGDAKGIFHALLFSYEFFHELFIPKIVHPYSNRVITYMINPKIAKSKRFDDKDFVRQGSSNELFNASLLRTLPGKLSSLGDD